MVRDRPLGEAAPVASGDGLSLPLLVAKNRSGYFGVSHQTSRTKPYRAQLKRGGEDVRFCSFATAEEAAQCVARSPEGQAAAERAAASSSHAVQAASADTAADSAAADIVKRARRLEGLGCGDVRGGADIFSSPVDALCTPSGAEEDKTLADAVRVQSFPDWVWVWVKWVWVPARRVSAALTGDRLWAARAALGSEA